MILEYLDFHKQLGVKGELLILYWSGMYGDSVSQWKAVLDSIFLRSYGALTFTSVAEIAERVFLRREYYGATRLFL